MKLEIWKDVEGLENHYQVSNLGRVKSLERIIVCRNGVRRRVNEIILKPVKDKNDYSRITLAISSHKTNVAIHRLVLETFNEVSPLQVNHKDGNKNNNRLSNLEYCSSIDNIKHRESIINNKKRWGVYKIKASGKFRALISINDKRVHLGMFNSKEEAYKRFFDKYIEIHGEKPWNEEGL